MTTVFWQIYNNIVEHPPNSLTHSLAHILFEHWECEIASGGLVYSQNKRKGVGRWPWTLSKYVEH